MARSAATPIAEPPSRSRAAAVRTLELEAEALRQLANGLDQAFDQAVEVLATVAGRVIVSGMGKSGHVGSKIAATLASTGTPAQFVHPAEASHGDLGMITPADAVLALSNSGETAELSDLIVHTRRYGIPLVAITRNATSALGEAADVTLCLPSVAEACPLGLAPTTSTTATLALGDALAVALLDRRGFTAADFQALHPGGSLGRKLARVLDLMHGGDSMPVVRPHQSMAEAILEMSAKRLGCTGVVDGAGHLIGIITDGDLRRHMAPELLGRPVSAIMTANPLTIRPQALAAEALGVMQAMSRTQLFVVEEGRPVGVIHVHDCLKAGLG
ncbi:MAG: KpsF/GutQ family sugar-phosphate isomerase [Alphaproteobacteria bacterium]|nr:KpsF/GutQ family sugar-phosphate isomerase [Alphaproteobacteria bacterium]TAD86606.1 MAG: KpsF/GutQ family sugar-phosphate isomerase [Alphaproteobacteria bacterium]